MTIDAAALPCTELAAGTPLYRVHRAVHAAWFVDDSPLGRFNPVRVSGRGSCYWSTEPLGAFVEHFRTAMAIDAADIEVRGLSVIELSAPSTVVDLTRRRALAAGVTGSLVAGSSYVEAQQLAADLQGVVDGVIWHARHDLAGALVCGAWVGDAGVPEGCRAGHVAGAGDRTDPHGARRARRGRVRLSRAAEAAVARATATRSSEHVRNRG